MGQAWLAERRDPAKDSSAGAVADSVDTVNDRFFGFASGQREWGRLRPTTVATGAGAARPTGALLAVEEPTPNQRVAPGWGGVPEKPPDATIWDQILLAGHGAS